MGFGEDTLKALLVVAEQLLCFFLGDVPAADQRLGVELADRALGLDEVVHERLRHRGVIALVVAAAPVADHVDDDVLVEPLTELVSELADADHCFRIVAVHVEHRSLDHLGDVRGVGGRTRRGRGGGEPDLVVDHDVDRSARAVAPQLGKVAVSPRRPGRANAASPCTMMGSTGKASPRPGGPAWPARCPPARSQPPRGARGWQRGRPWSPCRCPR